MSRVPKAFTNYAREYNIWAMMKQRCSNPKAANYVNYGAKGISYSAEFAVFGSFLQYLGPAPTAQHTLDRIDNSKGYSPENCRWADVETQQNNRTNGVHYDGLSTPQLARKNGMTPEGMKHRLQILGMTVEQAVASPRMSWVQRPVSQKTLDGVEVMQHASLAAAATYLHNPLAEPRGREFVRKAIWSAVKRGAKYQGFYWAYVE